MNKNVQDSVTVARPFSSSVGEHIGIELGAKMVKSYYDVHPDQAYGHLIGRDIIEKMLAQPGCAGLSIHPAYAKNSTVPTLVLAGVDAEGQEILEYSMICETGNIEMNEGLIVDKIVTTSAQWF